MSVYVDQGTIGVTAIVTQEPDRSGNFCCTGDADQVDINISFTYASLLGGGKIVLKGDFIIDARLRIPSNIHIVLIGSVTFDDGATVDYRGMVENFDAEAAGNINIVIEGGIWDGNSAGNAGDYSTIYMEGVSGCKFYNFWVTGAHRDTGGRGEGLEVFESNDCLIIGLHAYENEYDGIKIRQNSLDIVVDSCDCYDNWASGVQAALGCSEIVISECVIWTTARASNPLAPYCRGVTLHSTDDTVVSDCKIRNVDRGILLLVDNGDTTSRNIVHDNEVKDSEFGIYCTHTGANPCTMTHNKFHDNTIYNIDAGTGIGFLVGAGVGIEFHYNYIEHNIFYDMPTGIDFPATNKDDNYVRFNGFHTVTTTATAAALLGNWFEGNIGRVEYDRSTTYTSATFTQPGTGAISYAPISGLRTDAWEPAIEQVAACDGELKNLIVDIQNAPGAGNSWVITVRLNNGNTALTVTINNPDTQESDTVNSVAVTKGQRWTYGCLPVGGPAGTRIKFGVEFIHAHPDRP